MVHTNDYMPHRDAEFDDWFDNLTMCVRGKTSAAAGLDAVYTNWHRTYGGEKRREQSGDGSHPPFAAQYLKFATVTNEYRTTMGRHNRDDSSTVIPVPATRATITDIRAVVGYQVKSGPATSRRQTVARCLTALTVACSTTRGARSGMIMSWL